MPVGTLLINSLLHLTFAWEVREVVGSLSVDWMVVVRTWVASFSWAMDVAGPPMMTKLPFGVHLAADIRILAWRGALTRALLQTETNGAGAILAWARRWAVAVEWEREIMRLALAGSLGATAAAYEVGCDMPLPAGGAWALGFSILVPIVPSSAEGPGFPLGGLGPPCLSAGAGLGRGAVGWVGLGLGVVAGAGGWVGERGEGMGRGLGGAGNMGYRGGTTEAVGVASSESIAVSSCNPWRSTNCVARPEGSRGEGGAVEGEGEGKEVV